MSGHLGLDGRRDLRLAREARQRVSDTLMSASFEPFQDNRVKGGPARPEPQRLTPVHQPQLMFGRNLTEVIDARTDAEKRARRWTMRQARLRKATVPTGVS